MRRILAALVAVLCALGPAGSAAADPGADWAWFRPTADQVSGLTVAGRYLVPAAWGSGKALTRDEARFLLTRGIIILLNFEWAPTGMRGGYAQGVRDARNAELARVELHAPAAAIYFSADWDVQPSEIPAVLAYLRGVADTIGRTRTGVYGGLRAVSAALDAGYPWAWQTYAWSHGRWDPRATWRQTRNGALWGGQGDRDESVGPVSGWWTGTTFPIQGGEQQRPFIPAPPAPPPPATYRVRAGDTLTAISRRYGVPVAELVRLNHLANPDRIYPGQTLRVTPAVTQSKAAGTYTVRRGDTLAAIAAAHHTTWRALAALNHLANPNRIYPGQRLRLP